MIVRTKLWRKPQCDVANSVKLKRKTNGAEPVISAVTRSRRKFPSQPSQHSYTLLLFFFFFSSSPSPPPPWRCFFTHRRTFSIYVSCSPVPLGSLGLSKSARSLALTETKLRAICRLPSREPLSHLDV